MLVIARVAERAMRRVIAAGFRSTLHRLGTGLPSVADATGGLARRDIRARVTSGISFLLLHGSSISFHAARDRLDKPIILLAKLQPHVCVHGAGFGLLVMQFSIWCHRVGFANRFSCVRATSSTTAPITRAVDSLLKLRNGSSIFGNERFEAQEYDRASARLGKPARMKKRAIFPAALNRVQA